MHYSLKGCQAASAWLPPSYSLILWWRWTSSPPPQVTPPPHTHPHSTRLRPACHPLEVLPLGALLRHAVVEVQPLERAERDERRLQVEVRQEVGQAPPGPGPPVPPTATVLRPAWAGGGGRGWPSAGNAGGLLMEGFRADPQRDPPAPTLCQTPVPRQKPIGHHSVAALAFPSVSVEWVVG